MQPKLAPRLGLGLRVQIILALCVVYALSLTLLGMVAVQLTRRAAEVDRIQTAQTLLSSLCLSIESQPNISHRQLNARVEQLLSDYPGSALIFERDNGSVYSFGKEPPNQGVERYIPSIGRVKLWLTPMPGADTSALTNLLLFYLILTGGVLALLTYIALTYSIVRPVERLIQSSERLAAGSQQVRVPEKGAAEVKRMAITFNKMAEQLRAERLALEQRLEELEQTTGELQTAQEQIIRGEKLATVGRLAAGVAHEIGNPLSAILGLVELLESGELDAIEQEEFLRRIRLETERINTIIRDLLNFSRRGVESEDLKVSSDVHRVVMDAVNLVKPLKELRDVQIEILAPQKLPRVVGPQHKLTQVVLNLLLNSTDALDGQGRIGIEIAHLRKDNYVSLVVSDTGPGIEPEMLDRIFEPFTTTKPAGKGTGLGLAVCHTLVETVGGEIRATNPGEGGARFEIQLKIVNS